MKHEKYDDDRLAEHMVKWGKVMGIGEWSCKTQTEMCVLLRKCFCVWRWPTCVLRKKSKVQQIRSIGKYQNALRSSRETNSGFEISSESLPEFETSFSL